MIDFGVVLINIPSTSDKNYRSITTTNNVDLRFLLLLKLKEKVNERENDVLGGEANQKSTAIRRHPLPASSEEEWQP